MSYTLQEGSKGTALRLILEPIGKLLVPRIAGPSDSTSDRNLRLSLSVLTRNEQSSPDDGVSGHIHYYPKEGVKESAELEGVLYCAAEHMARLARALRWYGDATEWAIQTEDLKASDELPSPDYMVEPSQPVAVRDLAALHQFRRAEESSEAGPPSPIGIIQNLLERIEGHLRAGVRIRIF